MNESNIRHQNVSLIRFHYANRLFYVENTEFESVWSSLQMKCIASLPIPQIIYVDTKGVEPLCDQLRFLLVMSQSRYVSVNIFKNFFHTNLFLYTLVLIARTHVAITRITSGTKESVIIAFQCELFFFFFISISFFSMLEATHNLLLLVLRTLPNGSVFFRAKYQNRTAFSVWKTDALPISYISLLIKINFSYIVPFPI